MRDCTAAHLCIELDVAFSEATPSSETRKTLGKSKSGLFRKAPFVNCRRKRKNKIRKKSRIERAVGKTSSIDAFPPPGGGAVDCAPECLEKNAPPMSSSESMKTITTR